MANDTRAIRVALHSTVTESRTSLHDILEEEEPNFELLKHSKMFGSAQKLEMKELNQKLELYMHKNKDKEAEILALKEQLRKRYGILANPNDDIKQKLSLIRHKQMEIFKLRQSQVEDEIDLNRRKSKISAMEESHARLIQERRELEAKIENVTAEIRKSESETAHDQNLIDQIRPERERLEKERLQRVVAHDKNIEALLLQRKKGVVIKPFEDVNIDFTKIEWNKKYTTESSSEDLDRDIKVLELKIKKLREESSSLDKQLWHITREKATLEIDVQRLENELRTAEANCESLRKQIQINENSHREELAVLHQKIQDQEAIKAELEIELQRAIDALKQMPDGHNGKESILAEIAEMERLLLEKRKIRNDVIIQLKEEERKTDEGKSKL